MANLLGSNIGQNYKSILNLDATTINTPLDATLRAVTDGMGTSSPLQLSTTKVAIGTNLYFNGITSAFPMIKRNGAAIDFRLADDSGFCGINAGATIIKGSGTTSATTSLLVQNSVGTAALTVRDDLTSTFGGNTIINGSFTNNAGIASNINTTLYISGFLNVNGASQSVAGLNTTRLCAQTDLSVGFQGGADASSITELRSTTKGFLPPRMTTTQKNAIASPATGLVVYDTTLNKLAVFTTVWEAVTSS